MPVAVNIEVKDTTQAANPVAGVTVTIWSAADVFQTSAATDGNGVATFALNGAAAPGTQYYARFFKTGVSFAGRKTVYAVDPEPAAGNDFKETAEIHTLPVATDTNFCRCSGYFVGTTGTVIPNKQVLLLRSTAQVADDVAWPGDPVGIDNRLVVNADVVVETDSSGYVVFDLPRNGKFNAVVTGLEDRRASFIVPDASSIEILDLLFPVPLTLTLNPVAVAVTVGSTKTSAVTLALSNGLSSTDLTPLTFTSSDDTIATAITKGMDLVVTGVAAGNATITASLAEGAHPSRIPAPTLSGATLTVQVQ